jgi:hypothetical protein
MTAMRQRHSNPSPRRHHHVPRFYLARFSDSGTNEGQLRAFDLQLNRLFPVSVEDAAVEKDFYKSKFRDGRDPMSIETALARLEGELAVTIGRVIERRRIEVEDRSDILNFLALQIIRGPRQRAIDVDAMKMTFQQMMTETVSSPAAWEHTLNRLRDAGEVVPRIPYAAAKHFVEKRAFSVNVEIPNSRHIEMFVKLSDPVLQLLTRRIWRIAQTADGCELVTSDTPVGIVGLAGTGKRIIGFGTPNTMVVMPLTPRLLLYGCFGNVEMAAPMPQEEVALINTTLVCSSHRFVYARSEAFFLRNDSGAVRGTIEIMSELRKMCSELEGNLETAKGDIQN